MSQNSPSKSLSVYAKRADEAEQILATLQTQIDYLTTLNKQQQSTTKSSPNEPSKTNAISSSNKRSKIEIEDLILSELDDEKSFDTRQFVRKYGLLQNDVYGVLNSLEGAEFIMKQQKSESKTIISNEGINCIENGSPEVQVFNLLGDADTIDLGAINKKDKTMKIGLGKAVQRQWLKVDKKNKKIHKLVPSVTDEIRSQLIEIRTSGGDTSMCSASLITDLKKRKLLKIGQIKYFMVSRGDKYCRERVRPISEITLNEIEKHMNMETGEWEGPQIKAFNVNSLGQTIEFGALHPLMKMREDMRNILLSMGFEEMETNNYVESSFWNFDALFQPQQHPARDAHDTFFLEQPSTSAIEEPGYLRRVKKTHSEGGYGSIGWRYDWKESEAKKNLLRTHTTAVSSRTLYKLAQQKPFKPKKYFSIDRVFRNESIDATHLAEFHQVEGFIADYDLTLGHLIGVIHEFFKRIGIPDVRFKPAYNPYTEPSMEIFGWSNERETWIEVGNSGVFRPEMLEPMGFPPNVKVIAWGLGLERPCMIATGVKDIRQLFGPRVDVNMVKSFPFVRYD